MILVNPTNCQMAVVLLGNKSLKPEIKTFLDNKGGVPSQFITIDTMKRAQERLDVFANLLKQINAKMKLDLYRLSLPTIKNTILIGVDIVNEGNKRVMGCSASYNHYMTQYFTKTYNQ